MTSSFDWDSFYSTSLVPTGLADADPDDPHALYEEPGPDQRWSTWPETARTLDRGPHPRPAWVVAHDGAFDTELGVLKTGKEADAFLIERALPPTLRTGAEGESAPMVAKRYRSDQHSSFHRSAQYTEGRRVKDSREARAIARGSAFGREAAADRWARTEFDVLSRLWSAGLPVPYPVQIVGTEVLMEFIGTVGGSASTAVDSTTHSTVDSTPVAAPRLHERRPTPERAEQWARQLHGVVMDLAALGLVHGDLSAYNVLVDTREADERLVVIDVPQVIDLIANPSGERFLRRDCENVCTWLRAHGAPAELVDPGRWFEEAVAAPH
ncbi:serine protein kinase RIO [Brachybacterium sp. DNPG3]